MMHREESDLIILVKLHNAGPEKRPAREIEGSPSLFDDELLQFILSINLGWPAQIYDRQCNGKVWRDDLRRLSINYGECCSQGFVASHDLDADAPERFPG